MTAAIDELIDVGLRRASMDAIAHRAGTGKAVLYRRWPNARALIIDAIVDTMESMQLPTEESSGSLREDFCSIGRALATFLDSPRGAVLRELFAEASREPRMLAELDLRYRVPEAARIDRLIDQAMRRGEISAGPVDPLVIQILPATILHQWLMLGQAPPGPVVEHIVDTMVMPLLQR